MKPTVAIVGSGPAGAIAAWACHLQGVTAHVISNTATPSALPGAQYLHRPFVLPGNVKVDPVTITYAKMGKREDYAMKIYGDHFDPGQTSWDLFPAGRIYGWPLRKIYEMLYGAMALTIEEVDRDVMGELLRTYDVVFNSAPAALFTIRDSTPVEVKTERVWIRTMRADYQEPGHGLIVYEGSLSVPHYRYSFLEGKEAWEYPESWGGGSGATLVSKPLSINKPPMDPRIIPVGRYGKWQKGVLVDSVFGEVSEHVRKIHGQN